MYKIARKFISVTLFSLLLFTFIGLKIDNFLKTSPIFILIGILYSLAGSFYLLFQDIKKYDKKNISRNKQNSNNN